MKVVYYDLLTAPSLASPTASAESRGEYGPWCPIRPGDPSTYKVELEEQSSRWSPETRPLRFTSCSPWSSF